MNYLKFTKFLKEDYEKSNSKFPSIKFFRSDLILIFIWFWILEKHYKKKEFSIEQLISEIPKGYGSRPTLFKFIDLSIKNKFLIKIKSQQDKRKYNLRPSAQTLKEFEDWAKGFSGF